MPANHAVDFFEIPVLDIAGAKAFYGAAFGWTFKDWGAEYADIQGAGLSGGLRLVQAPPTTGGPLVILYSDDIVCERARGDRGRRHGRRRATSFPAAAASTSSTQVAASSPSGPRPDHVYVAGGREGRRPQAR